MKGMDRLARYKYIKQLVFWVCVMCDSVDKLALLFVEGLFRVNQPLNELGLIDGRQVNYNCARQPGL